MYGEDELLPISGLQHLLFCERQWGLIHLEQVWAENRLTAEGRVLHEQAHSGVGESRPGVRIARGLRLVSLRLGLTGQADVVEFRRERASVCVPRVDELALPYPIEYKRGKPKANACDEVQLCAQALCLEEMFGCRLQAGALFYGEIRRRTVVQFDAGLRRRVEDLSVRMHTLFDAQVTPQASYSRKCDSCSLFAGCLPRLIAKPPAVAHYLAGALADRDTVIE